MLNAQTGKGLSVKAAFTREGDTPGEDHAFTPQICLVRHGSCCVFSIDKIRMFMLAATVIGIGFHVGFRNGRNTEGSKPSTPSLAVLYMQSCSK